LSTEQPITVTYSLTGFETQVQQLEVISSPGEAPHLRPNPVVAELTAAPPPKPVKKKAVRKHVTKKPAPKPAAPPPAAAAPAPAPAAAAPAAPAQVPTFAPPPASGSPWPAPPTQQH
jgi:2-oxoglutarate dehydrogenase E2 component (dihydrolipoamide succinyltransferase)